MTGARMQVDLGVLVENLRVLRERIAPVQQMLVVKNDAYGHGLERVVVAAAGAGVRWFGAFDVATAVRVRAAAGDEPRIFSWLTVGDDEIAAALASGIELGVGDAGFLERIAVVSGGRAAPVHLKIDTGLHRNGIRPERWRAAVSRAAALEAAGDIRVVGIWSHIAETSDRADDASRAEYLWAVEQARDAGLRPGIRHLAASAAGYARPEFRFDLVRVGAFSYGIRSTGGPELKGIRPVATLLAPVTAVGAGTVEVGYGSLDGLASTLTGLVQVGTPAGRRDLVSVGETTLTVEGWPDAAVGDDIAVFGPGGLGESSVTTFAEAIGTVGEEIIVRVSPLVPRVYVDGAVSVHGE